MTTTAFHQRYLNDSVSTASPGRLLVMLYDRLCLDLRRAVAAVEAHRREDASAAMLHAQDILLELRGSLNVQEWPAGEQLGQLYTFLLTELVHANLKQDAEKVTACLGIVEPLRDSWQEILDQLAPARGESA